MCICPVTKLTLHHQEVEGLAKVPPCPGATAKMAEMGHSFWYSGPPEQEAGSPPSSQFPDLANFPPWNDRTSVTLSLYQL